MAINPTSLLRHIKRKIGASHRPLPLSDEEILDTIYQETIYTFSNYFPFMYNVNINAGRDQAPGQEGVYILNTDGLELIGVAKFFRGYGMYSGEFYPNFQSQDFFMGQMSADLSSAMQVPDTFEFIPPNRVEIFPKYANANAYDMMFTVKCVHPQHLGTIPVALRDQFFRLAELDTKVSIYPILKNYDQLNTAYGTIDLKIEDFEQAEDQRRELLEVWDQQYFREAGRKRIWVY
jgi:hypothetical protein